MDGQPSIRQIEAACLTAWPPLRSAHDGSWIWRFARGYSKRANSFQAMDAADEGDAEARILRLAALSRRNGIAPVFRVTPLAGPGVVAALDRLGWPPFEESCVLAMPLAGEATPLAPNVRLYDPADPAWIDAQARLSATPAGQAATLRDIAGLIAAESAGLLVLDEAGLPVAAALAVQALGIGVYLNVVSDPARRRAGFGRQVMRAALDWTQAAGASHAAIQVLATNRPALMLYQSLGFTEIYRYHYRMER